MINFNGCLGERVFQGHRCRKRPKDAGSESRDDKVQHPLGEGERWHDRRVADELPGQEGELIDVNFLLPRKRKMKKKKFDRRSCSWYVRYRTCNFRIIFSSERFLYESRDSLLYFVSSCKFDFLIFFRLKFSQQSSPFLNIRFRWWSSDHEKIRQNKIFLLYLRNVTQSTNSN